MEALRGPADQTLKLPQLVHLGSCVRLVFGAAVQCSPCSVWKCMCSVQIVTGSLLETPGDGNLLYFCW